MAIGKYCSNTFKQIDQYEYAVKYQFGRGVQSF